MTIAIIAHRLTSEPSSSTIQKINKRLNVQQVDHTIAIDVGFSLKCPRCDQVNKWHYIQQVDHAVQINVAKENHTKNVAHIQDIETVRPVANDSITAREERKLLQAPENPFTLSLCVSTVEGVLLPSQWSR